MSMVREKLQVYKRIRKSENRTHEMHKEVEMLRKKRSKIILLENDVGEVCSRKYEIENTRIQYIEELYEDAGRDTHRWKDLNIKSKSPPRYYDRRTGIRNKGS